MTDPQPQSQQSGRCPCCGSVRGERRPECVYEAMLDAQEEPYEMHAIVSRRLRDLGGFDMPLGFYVKREDVQSLLDETLAAVTGNGPRP